MSRTTDAAGQAERPWRSGRLSRARAAASDTTDRQYGVDKPGVIDFLRDRSLDGLFDDRGTECPCGSGESYWGVSGQASRDLTR